jgi:hypothetical protein
VFNGANLKRGDKIAKAVGGVEVDGVLYNCSTDGLANAPDGSDGTPLNFHVLATIPATAGHGVIGYYVNQAGGVVFNIGTRNWGDGLADDPVVQLITRNVLDRLGSGERFVYDPLQSTVRTRELFNCPIDTPGVFPGWRGDEEGAALTQRCGYEGPRGLELSGTARVSMARNFTPTNAALKDVESRFYLNADNFTGPASASFTLLTMHNRQNGLNARTLQLDLSLRSTGGRAVRLSSIRADGTVETSTPLLDLAAGWNSVQVGFHAAGKLTLQVGTGTEVSLTSTRPDAAVNEVTLNWGRSAGPLEGFVCVDALAVGLQKLDPVAALR